MIIATSEPIVHAFRACRLVRIGRESSGGKVSVVIGDNKGGEQTVFLYPGEVLSGYARFQREVLRASGIHFDNQTFSTGPGRARRWQKLVYRLLQEGGTMSATLLESPKRRCPGVIKSWEYCSTAELWPRLLKQFPDLAIVKLMLSTARPPADLQGFHANLRVWRKVIARLDLLCFAPGSPFAGRTKRAIEWLLLDSAKPMANVAKKRRSA